ncbi:hypothetical protein K1T71_004661 [Dendrolimus kikuchii]|uniref:Uncharacterized protein n=1 Tax=Dendrolimus kikuchii TaxID=765133 RepID=A0ACC1D895_9NEOP|nr:hypothetical protein K1T71_004661 [Dendrolimus kikuchii]
MARLKADRQFPSIDLPSSSSSSGPIFENQQPFVLELHELSKDDQEPANLVVEKVKRLKKKKGQPPKRVDKSHTSVSSESVSEATSLSPTTDDAGKEEFYDARDSYHTMQSNLQLTTPVVAAGQLQVRSEHNQDPKLVADTRAQPTGVNNREPSTTVSKLIEMIMAIVG